MSQSGSVSRRPQTLSVKTGLSCFLGLGFFPPAVLPSPPPPIYTPAVSLVSPSLLPEFFPSQSAPSLLAHLHHHLIPPHLSFSSIHLSTYCTSSPRQISLYQSPGFLFSICWILGFLLCDVQFCLACTEPLTKVKFVLPVVSCVQVHLLHSS